MKLAALTGFEKKPQPSSVQKAASIEMPTGWVKQFPESSQCQKIQGTGHPALCKITPAMRNQQDRARTV